MAGANPERTSYVPDEIRGRLKPVWYKVFEPYLLSRTQIVAANGTLFVATARGLYALNADNGAEKWVYPTELPLGDTPTVVNGVVYIGGMDRKMHAVDANTGQKKWTFSAEAGFQVSPLVVNNTVYAGNRDGYFYAIDAGSGALKWKYKTGGSVVIGAAYKDNTLFFASNDSYVYALNASSGSLVWKSAKLGGGGFYSYWPVIYNDNVIFSGGMNYFVGGLGITTITQIELADIFPNYASLPRGTYAGPQVSYNSSDPNWAWAHGKKVLDMSRSNSGSVPATEYFENKPHRRTYYILSRSNGSEKTFDFDNDGEKEYAPILFLSNQGVNSRYPPVLGNDGVLYQGNMYKSDTVIAGGNIVGWKFGTPYISLVNDGWNAVDEPMAFAAGGNLMYWNRCCDRVGASFGYANSDPNNSYFSYNGTTALYTLAPGYNELYHNPYPLDYTSPLGSFGVNGVYGFHGDLNPPIPYRNLVYMHRSNAVIAFGNTTSSPVKLPRATIRSGGTADVVPSKDTIKSRLESEVQKIVTAGHLRPGLKSSGMVDNRGPRCMDEPIEYFHNPSDTIYTLAIALPYLSSTLSSQVKTYLQSEYNNFPPHTYNHIGWNQGAKREVFDTPPETQTAMSQRGPKTSANNFSGWSFNPFAFYAMYKYAEVFPTQAKSVFDTAKTKSVLMGAINNPPADSVLITYTQANNAYIAGLYGYMQLEKMAGYISDINQSGKYSEYNRLLNLRKNNFNKTGPWNNIYSGDIKYCRAFNVSRNFTYLTPELGAYLRNNISTKVQEALNEYSYLAPYWFVESSETEFAEGTLKNLYDVQAVFQAKALIMNESYSQLAKYIDVPAFEKGDLFYIQNLVYALQATGTGPTSGPTTTTAPTSPATPGDANGDGLVNIADYSVWLTNYNQILSGPIFGDFNSNGKVDGIDFIIWLKNYTG